MRNVNIEISDNAAGRFPAGVQRMKQPQGKYDLVLASGVLYGHYRWRKFHEMIWRLAWGVVVTCHLEDHEIQLQCEPTASKTFPYGDRLEVLRVYDFSAGGPVRARFVDRVES